MVRTSLAERLELLRPHILASAALAYPIAYWAIYLLSPGDPRAVTAIAVALIAWFGGLRVGLVVGVGLVTCNGILNGIVRDLEVTAILQHRAPILVGWLALAGIVGWFSDQARQQEAERRRAERLLSQTEERYRALVESIGEIIFQTDTAGRWTFLNPAWTAITGFTIEESLGHYIAARSARSANSASGWRSTTSGPAIRASATSRPSRSTPSKSIISSSTAWGCAFAPKGSKPPRRPRNSASLAATWRRATSSRARSHPPSSKNSSHRA
jgi:PAS domain-containing protein